MNTMAEYATLNTDVVKKGIAMSFVTVSDLMRYLPFMPVNGNAYAYNLESAAAAADFYADGEPIVEGTPTWEKRTAELFILLGDADVSLFAQDTRNQQDIKAAVIALKAKAIAEKFEGAFVLGRTTASATWNDERVFKGLTRVIAEFESSTTVDLDGINNAQVYPAHASSATLTLEMLDALIDRVKPAPTHLMMSRRTIRKVGSLARAAGNNLTHDNDALGMPVTKYGKQIIIPNDFIPDNVQDGSSSVLAIASYDPTTTRASGYDNTLIYALRFGEDGVQGLSNGMIQTEDIGKLENKDAERTRIKFYCGAACTSKLAAAVMINVTDGS